MSRQREKDHIWMERAVAFRLDLEDYDLLSETAEELRITTSKLVRIAVQRFLASLVFDYEKCDTLSEGTTVEKTLKKKERALRFE